VTTERVLFCPECDWESLFNEEYCPYCNVRLEESEEEVEVVEERFEKFTKKNRGEE